MSSSATVSSVRALARKVVECRQLGKLHAVLANTTFDLTEGGMCQRFVRQVHEAALGIPAFAWPYARRYAIQADFAMREAGLQVRDPEDADVVCFHGNKPITATPGHIAIYLGDGWVAENTISGLRGSPRPPGTKITRIGDIDPSGARRRFFRTVPSEVTTTVNTAYADGPLDVYGPDGAKIPCHGYLSNGRTGCNDVVTLLAKLHAAAPWPASYPAQMLGPVGEKLEDCTVYASGERLGVNNLRVLLDAYGFALSDEIISHRAVRVVGVL